MKRGRIAVVLAVMGLIVAVWLFVTVGRDDAVAVPTTPVSVLSVSTTTPQVDRAPVQVPATGNVVAWQEASVGAEADGLRLTEVRVNVGDAVRRGDVLATFDAALVEADLAEARAAVDLAIAEAADAQANARRARELDGSGAMSAQQISQYIAAAAAAQARLEGARAVEQRHRLRRAHTRVVASSDGIITARLATIGAVVPAGQELFRMIKDGRLEWRAVVGVADLDIVTPGQVAWIRIPGHAPIRGAVRMVAPDINTQTHSGLVYVDVPHDGALRAGVFVTGQIDVDEADTLTLPQGAVVLRDGFHYAMQVGSASNVVTKKVAVGRRFGDRIEITDGLAASDVVIASGLGFLSEGDIVRVVDTARAGTAAQPPRTSRAHAEALARSAP